MTIVISQVLQFNFVEIKAMCQDNLLIGGLGL